MENKDRKSPDALFDVAGVAATLASGVLGAWYEASRVFNNRILSKMKFIGDLQRDRDTQLKNLGLTEAEINAGKQVRPSRTAPVTPIVETVEKPPLTGEAFIQEEQRILREYQSAKAVALAKRGIKTPLDKWRLLDYHGKKDVITMATGVAAAALGVVIALGGVRSITKQQKDLDDRLNNMEKEKQR